MADEGFLSRWSRRKALVRQGQETAPQPQPDAPARADAVAPADPLAHAPAPAPASVPAPAREAGMAAPADDAAAVADAPRLPTMDDVAQLTPESDYSSFVARGVDQAVRRSALKKLFSDPHFNTMDRLDVYIDDYTKPSPVSEAMLASLQHAKKLFERVLDDDDEENAGQTQNQQPPEAETR